MEDTVFCGVFDGHGPYGHLVARRVRDSVPSKLLQFWEEHQANLGQHKPETPEHNGIAGNGVRNGAVHQNGRSTHSVNGEHKMVSTDTVEEGKEHPMFDVWKEAHLTGYRIMDKELRSHPGIDCFCSGTTAVTVLKQVNVFAVNTSE